MRVDPCRLGRPATLILVLLLSGATAKAEPAATRGGRSPWIGLGLGAGRFAGVTGVAGHVDVGWGLGRTYLAARLAGVADGLGCCESTRGDRTDAAVVLGFQRVAGSGQLSVGAGPAHVRGQGFADTSWGLALEARLVRWGTRGIGPALYAFGNLNSRDSFFGLTVGLRFGGR